MLDATASPRVAAPQVRQWAWPLAVIGAAWVIFLPALWNGFPFMFYDTGAFIEQALKPKFVAERQVFYAWFLLLFFPIWSLWPVVIAQSAITVWVTSLVTHSGLTCLSFW